MEKAFSTIDIAQRKVVEANRIITEALGLADWHPNEPLSYIAKASEVFAIGRIDSEYYQPKYRDLRAHINSHNGARLRDVLEEKIRRGISPQYVDNGNVQVINSKHIGKNHITLDNNRTTSQEFIEDISNKNSKGIVKKWDVLLNSTGRITIGRCQCLLDDICAVADNHVSIIRPHSTLDPVYLAFFLNSKFGLMQTEQSHTGSSGQIELSPSLIEDFTIWIAPEDVQRNIREAVLSAHTSRNKAKLLLETAKKAVEISIEENEDASLEYLSSRQES